jgi:hypothetical protein
MPLFGGGEKEKKEEKKSYRVKTGDIIYPDEKREGLAAIIKLAESVNVEQDHYGEIEDINFTGKLEVMNPSTNNRLWDILLKFEDVEATDLKSPEIEIKELGTEEDDNTYSQEFELAEKVQNLLLIKEYINTLSNADEILRYGNIKDNILALKEPEEERVEQRNLESFGIAIGQLNTVTFAIGIYNLFEKPITNLKLIKSIPSEFENIRIIDTTEGYADVEGEEVEWTIDDLEPERLAVLKIRADITVETKDAVSTGVIQVSYEAASSFTGGLEIETFKGYTTNKHYMDLVEREEEPDMWECDLVFENPSEFDIELYDANVYAPEDPDRSYITIDPDYPLLLPPNAMWRSPMWEYESEDYPKFRRELGFRILPEFKAEVVGETALGEEQLVLASITGTLAYEFPEELAEKFPPNTLPSYEDNDVIAILTLENDGSAPLDEFRLTQRGFSDYPDFSPPDPNDMEDFERMELFIDGKPIELDLEDLRVSNDMIQVSKFDLKSTEEGMIKPDSTVEFRYPIHAIQPREGEFESDVIYNANTYPLGEELATAPVPEEVPVISIVHVRRKVRVGKEITPLGAEGKYQITIFLRNLGDSKENEIENLTVIDKVPDNFEYGEFSVEPEIIDEYGEDTLKWEIELLEPEEELEITYEIEGKGEYHPSKAQLTY